MAPFIQCIHVLCGVSLFGIILASFIYIANSFKQKNSALLFYALKTSLIGDCILFPMIIIQFFTGAFMVHYHQLSFQTPWIIVAFFALSVVSVIWFFLLCIKYVNFSSRCEKFRFKKTFIILNIFLILLFCMIIHDAVTQQTWLWRYA